MSYLFLGVRPTVHPDEPWAPPFCPGGLVRSFRNKETFLPSEVGTFRSRERPCKPLGILVWGST